MEIEAFAFDAEDEAVVVQARRLLGLPPWIREVPAAGVAMQQLSFEWSLMEPKIDPGLQRFVLGVQIQGGYIVSANDCSADELAQAKADGRFYRSAGDLEYVHRK